MTDGLAPSSNHALCASCGSTVPAQIQRRGDEVVLLKECPRCGQTRTVVSTDAERYFAKRRLGEPDASRSPSCKLDCLACAQHAPAKLVLLDVTHRCNQNCPICLNRAPETAPLRDMSRQDIEAIIEHYARRDPKPAVQFYGGEPTVREDLIELVQFAQRAGLYTRVLTNGLRLASPEYCARLAATGAEILFSFDGVQPRMYRHLRGGEAALDAKLRALDNLGRQPKAKVVIMCTIARGYNDDGIPDLLRFCHERQHFIRALFLIPLAHTWSHGAPIAHAERIAPEAVEGLVDAAFPNPRVEFIPAGIVGRLSNLLSRFHVKPLTFFGAHPNCESFTVLLTDGETFEPLDAFLAASPLDFAADLAGIKPASGRILTLLRAMRVLFRHVRVAKLLKGRGVTKFAHAAGLIAGLAFAKRTRTVLRRHANVAGVFPVVILPFADPDTIESDRLRHCPTAVATMDANTRHIREVPVCAWGRCQTQLSSEWANPA